MSKIEGKGNGIKTVIVNLSSVAASLARPPSWVIKYFGFELGAQTNTNPSDDRWIINGAHEASKLQDYLDGFINKFVLCKKCKNPETEVNVKDDLIFLDCKACGQRSDVDLRLKLSSFILKNQPKKGKKDKSTKKADRKARKEQNAATGGDARTGSQSPEGSGSDRGDDNAEVELEAGSDDELTRKIQSEAKEIASQHKEENFEWTVDTSEAAQKARAQGLPEDLKRSLVIEGEDEEGESESSPYSVLGAWIDSTAAEKGGVDKVGDVEIYLKAKELGIVTKHKTLTVLVQALFNDNILRQIDARASMLKKVRPDLVCFSIIHC